MRFPFFVFLPVSITSDNTGKLLLQQVASGNEQAFSSLYHHYNPRIYSAAMHYLKNETLAEEIVQEVFLKIWQRREKMAAVESPDDYIFIIARNSIFTHLHKHALEITFRKKSAYLQAASVNDADYPARQRQYDLLLQTAVQQLPEQRKRAYLLAKEQGLSHKQIATMLGISSLTVKKQVALANRQVRAYINQHLHSFVTLPLLYIEFFGN
jgi:RNA polymerase sigma-70 factor (ECF subfamily)